MQPPSNDDMAAKMNEFVVLLTNPAVQQGLMTEGNQPKWKEILVKLAENGDVLKDADQYFTTAAQPNALGGMPGQMPGMAPSPLEQGGMPNGQTQQGPGTPTDFIGANPGQPGVGSFGAF